jgi:dTDP-4-amino-4,6-dideoxygalactose transaminase
MTSIPFSLPLIDSAVVEEVRDALCNTGWITSGPKVQQFEAELAEFTGSSHVVAVNSWTSGAMVTLRWLGVGPGDEVIIPAYTYAATALAVLNVGAQPVIVDTGDDFNIDGSSIADAITERTKAIIPVDVGGWPCDYDEISELVTSRVVGNRFEAKSPRQAKLGRPIVLADAAHSIGATYSGRRVGTLADVTVLSFHSVKNITTGEGGAICLSLPDEFDSVAACAEFKRLSLNGQTKTALQKSQVGGWQYDIVEQGLKANMPDICAAIGLAQLRRYEDELLPERVKIFETYRQALSQHQWAIVPPSKSSRKTSSCHLFQLRVDGFDAAQRNAMIEHIQGQGVAVNVHYVPLPELTLFEQLGFEMQDYPRAFAAYQNEISLPLYNGLTEEAVDRVIKAVELAYQKTSDGYRSAA